MRRNLGWRGRLFQRVSLLVIKLQLGGTEQVLELLERAGTANWRGHPGNSEKPGESDLGNGTTTTRRNCRSCIYDTEVALEGVGDPGTRGSTAE